MRVIGVLAGVGLLVGSLVAAAPVAAGDPCFHDMSRPAVSEGNATTVKLDKCAFFPTVAHVPVGTEVQFVNADMVGHEVVGANLTWGHHEKILGTGDTLGVPFAKAGIYPYTCMIHPGMTGAIIVGDALSATGGAPAADADAPVQQAAGATPASALPAVLGLATLAVVAVLGASIQARRRRSTTTRPTA